MAIFERDTCHNLKPYKMKNKNGWWRSIFRKENNFHLKIPIVPHVKF